MDQRRRPLHVVLHVVLLVLDDGLFRPAAAATATARRRRLRLRSLAHRNLLELAVGAVITPLLLPGFFFALEADNGRFDPLVFLQAGLTLCQ